MATKKKVVGRPTKYSKKMIERVDEYLLEAVDEEVEFHKTRGEKSDSFERAIKVKLPTIEGFASYVNVATSTVKLWGTQYPEFSDALEKIKREQKNRLLDKGLSGDYNPTITKLILSSNHGMYEKQDITSGNEPLKLTFDNAFTSEAEGDSKKSS